MRYEAYETISREEDLSLLLPALHGILPQDVKQRVILRRGQRQLQDVSDKVGQHSAAPAALRLEVSGVRYRHVVREVESVEPRLFPVHRSRAESTALELPREAIDFSRPAAELLAVMEQISIVREIVKIHLEPAAPQEVHEGPFKRTARNHLECRTDPERLVQVGQRETELCAGGALDVVGHHCAARCPL